MRKNARIFVAGHRGLVGSAVVRELKRQEYSNIITMGRERVDLKSQCEVEKFFDIVAPDYVFLCAARVGGIQANNTLPANFIAENLKIQTNVIDAAHWAHVEKLIFMGSGCVYPRDCPQPIKEDYLLTGPLEKTNEAYAVAKIAGLKMCEFYRKQYGFDAVSVMPCNIYGPYDNFNMENSHVIPALIHKFYKNPQEIEIWGDGTARREFMHVDDLARALVFLMQNETSHDVYNIGTGQEHSITALVSFLSAISEFAGRVVFNERKLSGTPRKLLDSSRIYDMGWKPNIHLMDGLRDTYSWFSENYPQGVRK